ncbi:hypothetical protein DITRI_Ditri18aG0008100 [Diplodiscus trichospermus]
MAAALEQPIPTLSSKVKPFLDKYYHFLLESSKFVNRFYRDSSKISYLDQDRVISHVTTMKTLSDLFRSFADAKKYDITFYDTQDSMDGGLFVSVIGNMTTLKNDKTRKFSQSFFLVPDQEADFFVLNDVFRFHGDDDNGETSNSNQEATSTKPSPPHVLVVANMSVALEQPVPMLSSKVEAFLDKYYHFLQESSKFVNRFYRDSSKITFADDQDRVISHVATLKTISDRFRSFADAKKYDISTVDTQDSLGGGLVVFVVGILTTKNDETRIFSHYFFLVPDQEQDFFVLNDSFRFQDDGAFLKFPGDDDNGETSNSNQKAQRAASEFVRQYYYLLGEFPEYVYRFYKDSSRVCWQGQDGVKIKLTTMEAITDHFLSLFGAKKQFENFAFNVQDSCDNGLFLVVIGRMTSKNGNKPKKFSQSFFLATQETGYFVLNDVLRFLDNDDDDEAMELHGGQTSDSAPDQENITTDYSLADQNNAANSPKNIISVPEKSDASALQETDLHIVDFLEATTIFVGNLDKEAEVEELTEAFKRFGTIKPNGVHIKSGKRNECYAFIDFESPTSVEIAVSQGSSIMIGNRKIRVEVARSQQIC